MMEGADDVEKVEPEEDILVDGIHFTEWEEDRLDWVMNAERGRYYHEIERVDFEAVEVTFFPAAGGKLVLWADKVEYDLETKGLTGFRNHPLTSNYCQPGVYFH